MQIFYIVLGSILATFGGFLHLLYQSRQARIKEDKNVLIQSLDVFDSLKRIPETGKPEKSSFEHFDDLYHLSFKIQCPEYKIISTDIYNFVQENRGKDPMQDKGLREKISDLSKKIEDELRKKITIINIAILFKSIANFFKKKEKKNEENKKRKKS